MSEARAAIDRIVRDGARAGEIIQRIRSLAKNAGTTLVPICRSIHCGVVRHQP
jgi:hypothetical protein